MYEPPFKADRFYFHVLGYSEAVVIQGCRLSRLVFRRHLGQRKQMMYADTPPVVRPELRASADRLSVHALKDCDIFDNAEEICYIFVRDDRQTVWLHVSEIFELMTDGSAWLPYVDVTSYGANRYRRETLYQWHRKVPTGQFEATASLPHRMILVVPL